MARKNFLLGMLIMALVFGMMVVGCDNGSTSTIPDMPTGVTATRNPAGSTTVTVSWNAVSWARSYRVYYSASGSGSGTLEGSPTATSFNSTGNSTTGIHYFRVSAVNSAGEGSPSSWVSISDGAGSHNIGETGPGGGIVFYDKGNTYNGWRYLEAATVNQGTSLAWGSQYYYVTYITGTGTAIGTGKANTAAILAVDANAPAARACKNYNGGGKNDWFLPSKDKLNEIYKTRILLGISSGYYWSSSQDVSDTAWEQNFDGGSQWGNRKTSPYSNVRAIRAF